MVVVVVVVDSVVDSVVESLLAVGSVLAAVVLSEPADESPQSSPADWSGSTSTVSGSCGCCGRGRGGSNGLSGKMASFIWNQIKMINSSSLLALVWAYANGNNGHDEANEEDFLHFDFSFSVDCFTLRDECGELIDSFANSGAFIVNFCYEKCVIRMFISRTLFTREQLSNEMNWSSFEMSIFVQDKYYITRLVSYNQFSRSS